MQIFEEILNLKKKNLLKMRVIFHKIENLEYWIVFCPEKREKTDFWSNIYYFIYYSKNGVQYLNLTKEKFEKPIKL